MQQDIDRNTIDEEGEETTMNTEPIIIDIVNLPLDPFDDDN